MLRLLQQSSGIRERFRVLARGGAVWHAPLRASSPSGREAGPIPECLEASAI